MIDIVFWDYLKFFVSYWVCIVLSLIGEFYCIEIVNLLDGG